MNKLTPAARLIELTVRTSRSPLTYRSLELETGLSLDTLRDLVPALVRDGLIQRDVLGSTASFSAVEVANG